MELQYMVTVLLMTSLQISSFVLMIYELMNMKDSFSHYFDVWIASCSSLKKLSIVNLTDSTKRAYKNTSRG